jgi:hypothetical protein
MVDWKRTITDPQSTSVQVFGGDVLNYIVQYHNNVDLAAGDPLGEVVIGTKTTFGNGKIRLGDLNGDHSIDLSLPNYSENKTIIVPSTLPTTDDLVTRNVVQILNNKTISIDQNFVMHSTTNAAGDILVNDTSRFVRKPRGSSLQVLRTNSAGTDIEWASLDSERVGKSTASGNGSTNTFNIAHGLGSIPTYAFINCSSLVNTFTYTVNSTHIVVLFTPTAPPVGTNNITIYWRVVV